MMMNQNGGGAAFPFSPNDHSTSHMATNGMTLRDWFAGQALTALGELNPNLPGSLASAQTWPDPQELADRRSKWAYLQADAMLTARGRP